MGGKAKQGRLMAVVVGHADEPQQSDSCSKRCKDVDLNRWLSGAYVLPGREEEPGSSDEGNAS